MPETATFDHYEVLTRDDGSLYELGRGAMGVTYKAFDTSLRFPVCLKVINSAYLNSELARQRFIREARSAAKLRHRNVASVFHLGTEGDTWFYAMEFIDGETLEALIKRQGTLSPKVALEITAQVARALNAASQHGLVHRDIKPANLMLVHEDDEVIAKVIDFGLAKTSIAEGEDAATLSLGGFVGTPHFASPEQLEERDLDVRSDIYSLGITLWYMLAGQPPFGGSMAQVMSQHLSKPPPFDKFKTLPPPVSDLLKKMLEKDPSDRFQTPSELRKAIEDVLGKLTHAPAVETAVAPQPAPTPSTASIEADEFATLLDTASNRPGETRFETGVTIANRYRITEALGETNAGRVFCADDTTQQRTVRLLVLHKEVLNNSGSCTALEREVELLRQVQHPNLLGVFDFETIENASFLAMEWTNGFTLLELLRARRELGADEAIALLKQAAAGVDYATRRGLTGLEFGLHQVMLHFAERIQKDTLLHQSMSQWPAFTLKLYPLGVTHDISSSQTWAGGQTVVGGASQSTPEGGDATGRYIRSLATIVYELLGGSVSPLMQGGAGMASSRYTPLSTLSEEGNEVLKQALDPAYAFASAQEFCDALAALDGLQVARREPLPASKSRSAPVSSPPVVPANKPAPPPQRAAPPPQRTAPPPQRTAPPPQAAAPPPARTSPPLIAPAPVAPVPVARTPIAPAPVFPQRPPQKKSSAPLIIVGAVAAVLVMGGGGAYVFTHKGGPEPKPTPEPQTPEVKKTDGDGKNQEEQRLAEERRRQEAERQASEKLAAEKKAAEEKQTMEAKRKQQEEDARVKNEKALAQQEARKKSLTAAIDLADRLDKGGDTQGALEGYLKAVKDFPDVGSKEGRTHIESLLDRLNQKDSPLKPEEFQKMRGQLVEAANFDVLPAMIILGENLRKKEPGESYKWFSKAAAAGDVASLYQIGLMLADGIKEGHNEFGVPDLEKSIAYFQMAADKGHAASKYALGECYMLAKGVVKDEVKGLKLIQEASAAKNVRAMNYMGVHLTARDDKRPDEQRRGEFDEAFKLFTEAKNLGFLDAQANLGVMYLNGRNPGAHASDPKKAFELFSEGAKKENPYCMFWLGRCYEMGLGVTKNRLTAESWQTKAAKAGDRQAIQWCIENKINFQNASDPSTGTPKSGIK